MFASKDNYDDVKKYYLGTYVKFKEEGDALFYIERVDPDKIVAKATNEELVGIDLTIGYNIEYALPGKAVFQYGGIVMMLSRIPARMWKKGMSNQNTKFEVMDKTGKWTKTNFSAELIESFINKPAYVDPMDALKAFCDETSDLEAAALTPRITFTRGGKLMVDQTIVAKYDFTNKVFTVKNLFTKEVKALFPTVTTKSVK